MKCTSFDVASVNRNGHSKVLLGGMPQGMMRTFGVVNVEASLLKSTQYDGGPDSRDLAHATSWGTTPLMIALRGSN